MSGVSDALIMACDAVCTRNLVRVCLAEGIA
jgi:hypothetical protein